MSDLPKTSFKICGNGKPILFLHGWGSNKECFDGVISNFSQFYKCVSIDFWGFGKSEEPKDVWGAYEYAKCVKSFLESSGIKQCYVVAHSFGGRVALCLCNMCNFVSKLILVDSAGLKPRFSIFKKLKILRYKQLKKQVLMGKKSKEVLTGFGSNDFKNAEQIMRKIFVKVVNEDLACEAKRLQVETKLIYGKHDKDTPIYMAKKFSKLIRRSSLCVLDAGHFSFIDKKDEFCTECLKFWGDYV